MFLKKLVNNGAFLSGKQAMIRQPAVDDVEVIVLTATSKENGIFKKSICSSLIPASLGKRLIYAIIIQLGPE